MRLSIAFPISIVTVGAWIAPYCFAAQPQETHAATPQAKESLGLPPRTAPTDYQAQGKAGAVTIGAEFIGHSATTSEATYTTEDFIVVEVGMFGPPDSRLQLSFSDFSLRVNEKKNASPAQRYESVFHSLKDPEWEPPESKSKGGISTGGSGGAPGDSAAAPPKMPMELRLKMEQRVQKAALPDGDYALPKAGLLFFRYGGKEQGIRSLELTYSGPAGTTTLDLQP